ncbi:hypothetical protein DE146DRAFT_648533 [Phaeosphaeria sp. MPI-PUGE-AT-0046c]|nr:hypothetical protein DE146DRAFT_648533 [Phaeosphaeria sp. MPI-PUGE-AT-0046c]
MSSPSSSHPSSRASSVTATPEHNPSVSHNNPTATFSLRTTLKKPFQGWSRELLRARDDDDDDYNFASGLRRGCEPQSS